MAKKQLKADKEKEIKSPEYQKAFEKQFAEKIVFMIEQIVTRFENQTLKELNKNTVVKFEDAQIGNFASVFLKLAKKVKRKLTKQFDNKRLEKATREVLSKVNEANQDKLYSRISNAVGIDKKRLIAEEGLKPRTNALMLETAQWAKKLRDDTLEEITAQTLRSMTQGTDLQEIINELKKTGKERKNKAKFIARNQIANFNSISTKIRAQNLGIQEAIWITSRDERVRKCHQVRDGKRFDLAKGLYSSCDQKTLLPGTDYQCFPGSIKINYSSFCEKIYRRLYSGELTELVFDNGMVFHSTPNHPIFTRTGFQAAGKVDIGEDVLCTHEHGFDGVKLNSNNMIPTFEQLFSASKLLGVKHTVSPAISGKFHGDISNSEIEVISFDRFLMDKIDAMLAEKITKLNFSKSDQMVILEFLTCSRKQGFAFRRSGNTPNSIMSVLDLVFSRLLIHLNPFELFCFAFGSWGNTSVEESFSNGSTVNSKMFGDTVFAMSVLVHGLDFIKRQIDFLRASPPMGDNKTNLFKLPRESSGMDSNFFGRVLEQDSRTYKACSVADKRSINFSGHVYNLQTVSEDYITQTTAVSNCRCDYRLIIPEFEEN